MPRLYARFSYAARECHSRVFLMAVDHAARKRTYTFCTVSRDFRAEVEALRPYLLRYASLQLRNSDAAEDAVQETLLAALAAEASYEGRANLRTWLTGILKHKIVDAIRRTSRESPLEGAAEES